MLESHLLPISHLPLPRSVISYILDATPLTAKNLQSFCKLNAGSCMYVCVSARVYMCMCLHGVCPHAGLVPVRCRYDLPTCTNGYVGTHTIV